jgi:hypothetical protein
MQLPGYLEVIYYLATLTVFFGVILLLGFRRKKMLNLRTVLLSLSTILLGIGIIGLLNYVIIGFIIGTFLMILGAIMFIFGLFSQMVHTYKQRYIDENTNR